MTKKVLNVNSISRYSKKSSRLILEEHGHCEVPAGCGGVVLRWINPTNTIPVNIWLHTNGEGILLLDGEQLVSNRILLTYGDHIFAIRIFPVLDGQGLVMFAGIDDEERLIQEKVERNCDVDNYLLSKPDGTWKYSVIAPVDDAWLHSGYDDSHWTPMIQSALKKPEEEDDGKFRFDRLSSIGAIGLGIKETGYSEAIWIRKSYTLARGNNL
jgi:hypothetical protein